MAERLTKGLVQVYTGDGKGKTTAAFGLALRAFGAGLHVCIIQFLKDGSSGEVSALRREIPCIQILCCGSKGFLFGTPSDFQYREAMTGLETCREILLEGIIDLLVLDEICTAVSLGLVEEEAVLGLLEQKPAWVEVVLTGRNATPGIIAAADLVTEMRAVKHPYETGQEARRGVEY